MERKTKQRILGVLVVIGLAIILFPFFQARKEFAAEATLIKAPPFPDQTLQTSAGANPPEQKQQVVGSTTTEIQPKEGGNQQPDDTISLLHPSAVNAKTADLNLKNQTPDNVNSDANTAGMKAPINADNNNPLAELTHEPVDNDQTTNSMDQPAISPKAIKVADAAVTPVAHSTRAKIKTRVKRIAHNTRPARHAKNQKATTPNPHDKNGLFGLKNAAWVIQIGNYKNKANALRIVNQLRAKGYRAFIQQVANTIGSGSSTRVFVGPESKQTAARALANRLENDLHIRGIVISYKPLTL